MRTFDVERRDPVLVETFATIARYPEGRTPRQIAKTTRLAASTVQDAVDRLLDRYYVRVVEGKPDNRSARTTPVCVVDNRCVLGIRILPTKLVGIITDLCCKLLPIPELPVEVPLTNIARGRRAPPEFHLPSADTVITALERLTIDLVKLVPPRYGAPLGLGVEMGGHMDPASGEVIYSPNLQWHRVPLGQRLKQSTRLDVTVENDVNALAVAEQWFGAGLGKSSFAVILMADGIGCGLILNNDLFHGATGAAGEFGHIVIEPNGPECRCGRVGCLEGVATDHAILKTIKEAKERHGEAGPDTVEEALRLATGGDRMATNTFRHAGEALGRALSILLNLINPERLVIESLNPDLTALLWRSANVVLRRAAFSTALDDCDIVRKRVAVELGARGAAAVAISRFVDLRAE